MLEADAAEPPAAPPPAATPIEPAPPADSVPAAGPSVVAAAEPEGAPAAPPPADAIVAGPMEAEPQEPLTPEPVAEAEPESAAAPEATALPPRCPAGPVRFVFQMDAAGRFTFVSPNFAELVGPRSAIAVGESWSEMGGASRPRSHRRGDQPDRPPRHLERRHAGMAARWRRPSRRRRSRRAAGLFARARSSKAIAASASSVRRNGERPLRRRRASCRRSGRRRRPASPTMSSASRGPVLSMARRLSVPEQDAFRRIAAALGAPAAEKQTPVKPPAAEACRCAGRPGASRRSGSRARRRGAGRACPRRRLRAGPAGCAARRP